MMSFDYFEPSVEMKLFELSRTIERKAENAVSLIRDTLHPFYSNNDNSANTIISMVRTSMNVRIAFLSIFISLMFLWALVQLVKYVKQKMAKKSRASTLNQVIII